MKIIAIIAAVVVAIVAALLVTLGYYGMFSEVEITERDAGNYLLVYKKHGGDYRNVAPVMDGIYNDLKENHSIEATRGFGLYYDNPQEVEAGKLRSIAGCIVEGKRVGDLAAITGKYNVKVYPLSKSIVIEFPYKGVLSIIVGVIKVYPALTAYMEAHDYAPRPVMEIYDQSGEKIEYITSIRLSDELFSSLLDVEH